MTSASPLPGGHALPADGLLVGRGGSPGEHPRHRRRVRRAPILALSGAVVLSGITGGAHLAANLVYDDELQRFQSAATVAQTAQQALLVEARALRSATGLAAELEAEDDAALLGQDRHDALASALSGGETLLTRNAALLDSAIPDAGAKPVWTWELFDHAATLSADRAVAEDLAVEFEQTAGDLGAATAGVSDAATAALASAAQAAAGFESQHVAARNLEIIALRDAAAALSASADGLDRGSISAYASLQAAADQVLASEQAELTEKAGPLREARLQVEAFARDLAPGVLLDFDWAVLVNGYGYGDSMGGYTTWWYGDPGYATIQLSDSIARQWPSDRSRAIVAHEVGHAISVRCRGRYDDSVQDDIEAWATAWALSRGFQDDANGTWAYGAPPPELVETAGGCR